MSNRVYESMTRVVVGDYVVRVWMPETGLALEPRQDVIDALCSGMNFIEIAVALERLNPAAYEILKDGQGGVVYPDWA